MTFWRLLLGVALVGVGFNLGVVWALWRVSKRLGRRFGEVAKWRSGEVADVTK